MRWLGRGSWRSSDARLSKCRRLVPMDYVGIKEHVARRDFSRASVPTSSRRHCALPGGRARFVPSHPSIARRATIARPFRAPRSCPFTKTDAPLSAGVSPLASSCGDGPFAELRAASLADGNQPLCSFPATA